ncbi:MAG: hypothetical protein QXP77_01790 [Candidatus Aenigmatarchaeota archaeon]
MKNWLRKITNEKTFCEIEKELKFFEREMSICRYDFFQGIKEIIESEDKELSKKFEIFLKAFDFGGSLVS